MAVASRVRVTFAGITFSGFTRDDAGRYVTVPTNVLRKLQASGKVAVFCNYSYTDDYFADAQNNNGRGARPVEVIGEVLEFGKPYLSSLDTAEGTISLSPYPNCSYTIREIK